MPIVNGLTTLSNAKLAAGIATTAFDSTIEYLIGKTSALLRNYLGCTLARATYSEVLPCSSRQMLILKEGPIVSITSMKMSGGTLTQDTDFRLDAQDKASGMVYRELGWMPIELTTGLTRDVVAAARNIEVAYEAGYYLPGDVHYVAGAADSLPIEISGVVDEIVALELKKIQTGTQGLKSYSEGGISFTWDDSFYSGTVNMGLSDRHAALLGAYRRPVIA